MIVRSNVGKGDKCGVGRGTAASGIGPQLVWMNDTGTRILRLRVSGYGRQRMGKPVLPSSPLVYLSKLLEL